ncbi:hypothetical protein [Pelagicoccus enzymogenes]|uniref:hypothetical protein n=1 Tax=Pelagicoccus enzymogenes TaxID=2773457 RepID=UPI0028122933|nr:hypothetical protein [Pelagicoccus enzymogenes]
MLPALSADCLLTSFQSPSSNPKAKVTPATITANDQNIWQNRKPKRAKTKSPTETKSQCTTFSKPPGT